MNRTLSEVPPSTSRKKLYDSLRDGMSSASDWFDAPKAETNGSAPGKGLAAVMAKTESATPASTVEAGTVDPKAAEPAARVVADLMPIIGDVSALIQKGDLDGAADLAGSLPETDRRALETAIAKAAKKGKLR